MRILVTGARGQLGFDCIRELKKRGFTDIIAIDKEELDITDDKAVSSFVSKCKPDVIMHNAAWTAVDKAEECKEAAYEINVLGTKYIAEAAEKIGSKMVYISTDYVFPGKGDKFYEVNDETGPISFYGLTKLQGEEAAKVCSRLFIVRISWAFGINGKNFVKTMLKLSETYNELTIVNDQIGSPTYTVDLARLLCDMIGTNKYGVYHATNEGVCSWADFAEEIFKQAKRNVIVHTVTTEEYLKEKPNQAHRPLNSRLSKLKLDESGFTRLPSWREAVKRYLVELDVVK